ncbi:MAG: hypothetical protein O3C67_06600 [Cyanobacteria bacterium]|nr:hypothetical protein [Cyanobacteriota bacterium]
MARSLDQIEKDLKALAANTAALDEKLQGLYGQYLPVLGTAVRQQLILAAYHLCTQTYPEAFLTLSKADREKLQAALRKLGKQGQSHIEALVNMDNVSATLSLLLNSKDGLAREAIAAAMDIAPEESEGAEAAEAFGESPEPSDPEEDFDAIAAPEPSPASDVEDGTGELAPTSDADASDAADFPNSATDRNGPDAAGDLDAVNGPAAAEDLEAADATADLKAPDAAGDLDAANGPDAADGADGAGRPEAAQPLRALPPQAMAAIAEALASRQPAEPPSPLHLAKRHVLMERQIRSILHTLSNMGNYLLKRAKILPDLPEAVLSAAAESDPGESTTTTPNLLSVIVEVGQRLEEEDAEDDEEDADLSDPLEDDGDAPERSMTHLVALNLRLGDIEFTDTQTALRRSKIQETLARLKQLSSRYQRLQQEKARAEAEATWRSTWFDEDN